MGSENLSDSDIRLKVELLVGEWKRRKEEEERRAKLTRGSGPASNSECPEGNIREKVEQSENIFF